MSDMMLVMTVDGKRVDVDWEDNPSVDALKARAKDTLTVDMHRYGSFEQTGSMAKPIVRNDTSMEVGCGDIVLYNGIQIATPAMITTATMIAAYRIFLFSEDMFNPGILRRSSGASRTVCSRNCRTGRNGPHRG